MDNDQFYTEALNAMIPNLTNLELETCLRVVNGEKREQIVMSYSISSGGFDNRCSKIREKAGMERKTNLRAGLLALIEQYRQRRM